MLLIGHLETKPKEKWNNFQMMWGELENDVYKEADIFNNNRWCVLYQSVK